MFCPKCGTKNEEGAKFCILCGNELVKSEEVSERSYGGEDNNIESEVQVESNTNVENNTSVVSSVSVESNTSTSVENKKVNKKIDFKSLIGMFIKPNESYEKNNQALSNPIMAGVLLIIPTLIMLFSTIIRNVISLVRVSRYEWGKGTIVSWEFKNILQLDFVDVVLKNFFIYLLVMVAIAGVFYIISLIFKKGMNFFKTVSIVAISFVPFAIFGYVLSPLLALIWGKLGVIFMIFAIVSMLVFIVSFINKEIDLKGDAQMMYYLVCFSVILISGYFVLIKYISSLLGL